MFNPTPRQFKYIKAALFALALLPALRLLVAGFAGQLGANPIEFVIRTTGLLTFIFLILSLAVTPIRLITGKNWLSHFRRMLGV